MRNIYAALLALGLAGCGLGTEVGNGFKPDRGDDKGTKKNASNAPDDVTATGALPTQANNSESSGPISDGKADADASTDTVEQGTLDVLTANCGSPFGDRLESPIDLGKLKATYNDQTALWTLTDPTGAPIALVKKDAAHGAFAVTATTPAGVPIGTGYTCDAPANDPDEHSIELHQNGRTTGRLNISWKFEPLTGGAYTGRLIQIDIYDADGDTANDHVLTAKQP